MTCDRDLRANVPAGETENLGINVLTPGRT
jgi:hypothetical protein